MYIYIRAIALCSISLYHYSIIYERYIQPAHCGGCGRHVCLQTFVNAGVATGIVPNTGMSLPFVSYGGSSMWTNMVALGLVLNIRKKETRSLFEGGLL